MEYITNPGVITLLVAALAVLYIYISSAVKGNKTTSLPTETKPAPVAKPVADTPKAETTTGDLVIEGADDETAAVIMAIVSHESGVPLNRLSFKSIRLMEE